MPIEPIEPTAIQRALAGTGRKAGTDTPELSPQQAAFLRAYGAAEQFNHLTVDKWTLHGINPNSIKVTDPSDSIEVNVPTLLAKSPNCPRLSVPLHPLLGSEQITGKKQYYAPLLVRNGGTLNQRPDLKNHILTGYTGQPPKDNKEIEIPKVGFGERGKTLTLQQVIERYTREDCNYLCQAMLGRDVPVIDVVPLIPISQDLPVGENYSPEFSLKLNIAEIPHHEYAVYIVSQDKLVYRLPLHGKPNEPIEIRIIDETDPKNKANKNWLAHSMSGIGDDQKVFIPGSAGQIKLLVVPIRFPRKQVDYSPLLASKDIDFSPMRSFNPTRGGGSASSTFLTQGDKGYKSGDLYKGDITVAAHETPIIYDIRPIAITPEKAAITTAADFTQALSGLPEPSMN